MKKFTAATTGADTERARYEEGYREGRADLALFRFKASENGYTYAEYLRIAAKMEEFVFFLQLGAADAYVKGYIDGGDTEAREIGKERNEPGLFLSQAPCTDLGEKYMDGICFALVKVAEDLCPACVLGKCLECEPEFESRGVVFDCACAGHCDGCGQILDSCECAAWAEKERVWALHEEGKQRFGSFCAHTQTINGTCLNCHRGVFYVEIRKKLR